MTIRSLLFFGYLQARKRAYVRNNVSPDQGQCYSFGRYLRSSIILCTIKIRGLCRIVTRDFYFNHPTERAY